MKGANIGGGISEPGKGCNKGLENTSHVQGTPCPELYGCRNPIVDAGTDELIEEKLQAKLQVGHCKFFPWAVDEHMDLDDINLHTQPNPSMEKMRYTY